MEGPEEDEGKKKKSKIAVEIEWDLKTEKQIHQSTLELSFPK